MLTDLKNSFTVGRLFINIPSVHEKHPKCSTLHLFHYLSVSQNFHLTSSFVTFAHDLNLLYINLHATCSTGSIQFTP